MESKLATKLEFWLPAAAGKNTKSNQNHTFLSPRKYVIKLSNEARHCDETRYRGVSLRNEEDRNDSFSTVIQREIGFLQLFLAVERLIGRNESLRYYRCPDTSRF